MIVNFMSNASQTTGKVPTHPELLSVSSATSVLIVINEPCLPTASQDRQAQLQSWLGGNKSLGYDSGGVLCP